jgi:hypothetical protein
MKIATLGSCQAVSLNWYIRKLIPDAECKWVAAEPFTHWKNNPAYTSTKGMYKSQGNYNIFNINKGIEYLKSADYIIYQKIDPLTSKLFNYEKIESYAKPSAKLVSLTYLYYDRALNDPVAGMIKREEKLLPDIKLSELILNNPKREQFIYNEKGTHCNSVLFLEILREVCEKLEWNFFDDDVYLEIKNKYYPFIKLK